MEPQQHISWLQRNKSYFIGIVVLIVLVFVVMTMLASLNSARNLGSSYKYETSLIPGAPQANYDSVSETSYRGGEWAPTPNPVSGYVPNLEEYETTDYRATARLRDLEAACGLVFSLKGSEEIHFKSLSEGKNFCSARFFVADEALALEVRNQLSDIRGVEITRDTNSVTRRRSDLKNHSAIVREQLQSVESTLTAAETQYAELTEIARSSGDASALATAIRDKLDILENLTQRRISLTSQLQSLEQQSADLEERIDVIAFSVSFDRKYAIDSERTERAWESAWQDLKEQFTAVLIGFSAYLGIFLLRLVQFVFYGLILLVVARLVWKVAARIWRL